MKKIFYLLAPVLLCSFVSYAQKGDPGEYNAMVKFTGSSAAGTISVLATGLGKTKALSIKDAAAAAFYTLMFRGIPGSQYELPMVPNENEKKNDPIVKALLGGGYTAFLTESSVVGEAKKKKKADGMKGLMTENNFTINCDALRRHLEQNNVIRKFGL